MTRKFLAVAVGAALVLGAACAHGNGSASAGDVRVATNAQDVAGCEKLSQVRLQGTWTSGAGRSELQRLVSGKSGNVLLLSGGATNEGVAYRCAGGTSAGSP